MRYVTCSHCGERVPGPSGHGKLSDKDRATHDAEIRKSDILSAWIDLQRQPDGYMLRVLAEHAAANGREVR